MNKDFHYYGTYVAARLAGYDLNTAQTIAHAAQYVDDSSKSTLIDDGKLYIKNLGFTPRPTVQTLTELSLYDTVEWTEAHLNETYRVWIPFHFLPANYSPNTNLKDYEGSKFDQGKFNYWQWDDESTEQFKLLCLPNSCLVQAMINDTKSSQYKNYMIGLRMHVLADTWAHEYYAGINAWFINNISNFEVETANGKVKLEIEPLISGGNAPESTKGTPNMPSYNSYAYLGHGRAGHNPDYPYIKYEYSPQWLSDRISKDNPSDFMKAFKQMVEAMMCIKSGQNFEVDSYATLDTDTERIINDILNTPKDDQCDTWKANIPKIKVNGQFLVVPEDYSADKWLNDMKKKDDDDKKSTDYYYFNYCASKHFNFVENSLKDQKIYIDETPQENIIEVKLKNHSDMYVGPKTGLTEYYPRMNSEEKAITLEIIKANSNPLKSGDIVRIRTSESEAGQYDYLGAWERKALYYYKKDYSLNKQKWQIEKVGGATGDVINYGDLVYIKNRYYLDEPYMIPYRYLLKDYFLTTTSNSSKDGIEWQITPSSGNYAQQFYYIINKNSGKFLNVEGNSNDAGAYIQQYHYTGGDNERFSLIAEGDLCHIKAKNSGLILTVKDNSKEAGAKIIQDRDNGGDNQKFRLVEEDNNRYCTIVARNSGKVLDVEDDNAKITQETSTGADSQKFILSPCIDEYFYIQAKNGQQVLTVHNDSKDSGTGIILESNNGKDSQKFSLIHIEENFYYIVNKNGFNVLAVKDASKNDGAPIIQERDNWGDEQKFRLIPSNSEYFKIMNKNSEKMFDVTDAIQGNDESVKQHYDANGDNQMFKFVKV